MAKRARSKSRSSAAKTASAPVEAAKDQNSVTAVAAKRTMGGRKGLRRRLRKLEGQLASAARQERKRLRRLERALWRRQRIEAAIDEIRTATALIESAAAKPAAKSGKAEAAAKPVAKSADKPADPKPAAAAAVPAKPRATKPAAAQAVPAKPRATKPAAAKAVPAKTAAAKTAAKPAAPKASNPKAAPQVSAVAAATLMADAPVPVVRRPAATKRAPVRRAARPRSNGAAGSPRPALPADPAPAPPTQR